ncbi:MAG: hypothetical protein HYX75_00805 [Acidobacteria bacterium]|nr:hypothetical protein [Acidobacteriota bacterium]
MDENQEVPPGEGWGRKILKAVIGTNEETAGVEPQTAELATSDVPAAEPVILPGVGGHNPQVDTLIRLIHDLPSEVNKKTGASIVRKTMAAMGVSVDEVLQEIRRAKGALTGEVDLHRNAIEDYKNQIATMEKSIDSSLKKAGQLDEILELFQ